MLWTRFSLLRRAALWQVRLLLVAWAAVFLALAAYAVGRRGSSLGGADTLIEHPAFALVVFAAGLAVAVGLWLWLKRGDFILVTDYRTYFFLHAVDQTVFCRRDELVRHRDDLDGILLDIKDAQVRVEEPAEVLIAVHNILMHWEIGDGKPQDPPHAPPWSLIGR